MTLTLTIPDSISDSLRKQGTVLERAVLEGFAAEAYRSGELSSLEVRVLLGHESRWETEEFLAAHDTWPGITVDDVRRDAADLDAVLPQP